MEVEITRGTSIKYQRSLGREEEDSDELPPARFPNLQTPAVALQPLNKEIIMFSRIIFSRNGRAQNGLKICQAGGRQRVRDNWC